jgi:hypothetical protein
MPLWRGMTGTPGPSSSARVRTGYGALFPGTTQCRRSWRPGMAPCGSAPKVPSVEVWRGMTNLTSRVWREVPSTTLRPAAYPVTGYRRSWSRGMGPCGWAPSRGWCGTMGGTGRSTLFRIATCPATRCMQSWNRAMVPCGWEPSTGWRGMTAGTGGSFPRGTGWVFSRCTCWSRVMAPCGWALRRAATRPTVGWCGTTGTTGRSWLPTTATCRQTTRYSHSWERATARCG